MGTLGNEFKTLQSRIQGDLFEILVKAKILSESSYSVKSRIPFYQFTLLYDLISRQMPEEAKNFLLAVQKLIKTNFLLVIVVDRNSHQIQFIRQKDYFLLSEFERMEYSVLPAEIITSEYLN